MVSRRVRVAVAILACVPVGAAAGQGGTGGIRAVDASPALRTTVAPGRGAAGVHLDGVLDEPVWGAADSIPSLTEIEPVAGGTPRGRTVVRVVADHGALVFGIRAENPPGVGLVAFARSRDAALDSEDHIK